ncbi:LppX_LprAFG lipoprotein [Nocardioides zeae]|uniref:LppX_LprAFG lipoprotein n=1 Tax=Nocardioides imazamoxiresistens TaxID=3231893 RepID=A0ABU3PZK8_9ACTN|nr:LppX_LprAFG lipoprotein [Nocardioides zeae]MDT9594584.1 LppX_LprAFG lipoprotein [Nocardioides zeae]
MSTPPPSDGEQQPQPRPSRRGWIIGSIIVVALVVAVAVPALLLGGDRGFERPDETPEEVLKAAKDELDETDGVRIAITASDIPDDVSTALVGADGTAVRPDGFSGVLNVRFAGGVVDADIVALDGVVNADLPFVGWSVVDPQDYNAPDPGLLLDPDQGISTLLTATDDPAADGEDAEACASGDDRTGFPYTGTLDGAVVRNFIPGADDGTFDARYLIDDEGRLCNARLTGAFYPGTDPMTYTVVFSDYGTTIDITAP